MVRGCRGVFSHSPAAPCMAHPCHPSSCSQQCWSLAVTHTHRWCPLHRISSLPWGSMVYRDLRHYWGMTSSWLPCDSCPYDGQPVLLWIRMPFQGLFLWWFSHSSFLFKSLHCEGTPKCFFSTSFRGPSSKTILPLSARAFPPGHEFPQWKLTFLDPQQEICLPNSVPCFVPSHVPAVPLLGWTSAKYNPYPCKTKCFLCTLPQQLCTYIPFLAI